MSAGNIPRMPDGSYMTPKDAIYTASSLTPEDIKNHSLICNVFCDKCRNYLPPHTTGRHFNKEDPVHNCPDHNREQLETEAVLLLGKAKIDTENYVEPQFIFCGLCYRGIPQGLGVKKQKDLGFGDFEMIWVCAECNRDVVS